MAAATALLAALGAGAWILFRTPAGPLPPPAVPWPATGKASVFLCENDSAYENCGDRAITAAQRLTVERTLRGLPEVTAVRFVSRAETLKELTTAYDSFSDNLRESDVPESFRVDLATTGGFLPKTETLPGVANVFVSGTSFWAGRTDVAVRLCPPDPLDRDTRCAGRGAATATEKAAVYQALRALDGVGDIYLEDRGHATKDARWTSSATSPETPEPHASVPECFHLVLDAPDAAARVRRAAGELPGVNTVDEERL
ncbi:permease-like cell division protein FtsX [Sphaerisporangium corydalis]|uniref:permease-like cell division protein FtsX n=1 Tax=Sphaerisporangium corydalis TaxID=1441875 RepID=UPI0021D32B5F|nr:permease-like cell division protein FtsX [Sphaerisporangium corydalis]